MFVDDLIFDKNLLGIFLSGIHILLHTHSLKQIVLQGEVSGSYMSDIALDDISFTPGCQVADSRKFIISMDIFNHQIILQLS